MADFVVDFGKIGAPVQPDGRLDAPAFHRNHAPIWSVIAEYLSIPGGDVLEIGSGTGQHAAEFAARAERVTWWPSDIAESHLRSIAAWRAHTALANLMPAQSIDLSDPDWTWTSGAGTGQRLHAILCINVLHISPWRTTQNLFNGAGRYLRDAGWLLVYGPFKVAGSHTAPSNERFDGILRTENPEWGVRDVSDLNALALANGMLEAKVSPMPANNLVLAFRRGLRQN